MKQDLKELVSYVKGFGQLNHAERIDFFAWYLHVHEKKLRFSQADLTQCYKKLNMAGPANIGTYLGRMETSKEILRDTRGRYLEHNAFERLDELYGNREISIQVSRLLEELPSKVPSHAEREFLTEAIICYKRSAYRAAVVMTWNLSYWHLCQYILKHWLREFNTAYSKRLDARWKRARVPEVRTFDDFSVDLQEIDVLDIAKYAVIINQDVYKIMSHALGRRNSAAHPSSIKIEQLQAESLIDDLVKNVVLTLSI